MSFNKRGLSEIITSLIVILLVFVAVGIIWFVVQNVLNSGADEIDNYDFTLDLEVQKVVLDDANDQLAVTVHRNSGEGKFTGLRFAIFDGTDTVIIDEFNVDLNELETDTFNLPYTRTSYKSITMAPTINTTTGEFVIGQVKDTIESSGSGTTPPPASPQILNVKNNSLEPNMATINWDTTEETNGTVFYGLTTNYDFSTVSPTVNFVPGTHTALLIAGINPGQKYYYQILSCLEDETCNTYNNSFTMLPVCTQGGPITADCFCGTVKLPYPPQIYCCSNIPSSNPC